MPRRFALVVALLAAAACGEAEEQPGPGPQVAAQAPLQTPAPGAPAGLPDDRTAIPEASFAAESAQGAANVLQTYYALIEDGRYADAFRLREAGARGPTLARFAASFDDYAEYHANIGRPSDIAGAAGSLYVEVPVQIYGRTKDGEPFSSAGTVTLRRSNGVPGGNREWRIYPTG